MFRHDAFHIQLAHTLKQRRSILCNVIGVVHSGCLDVRQQTPQFLLAIRQFLGSQVLAIGHQEVEGKKVRLAAMKQQVAKLRFTAFIQTHDFPVQDSLAWVWRFQFFA